MSQERPTLLKSVTNVSMAEMWSGMQTASVYQQEERGEVRGLTLE